jgi:hypothetical protein
MDFHVREREGPTTKLESDNGVAVALISGSLLAGILKAHPSLKGTLFDLPQVVGRARARLRELGLADLIEGVRARLTADDTCASTVHIAKRKGD